MQPVRPLPDAETLSTEFRIVIREWLIHEQCREIDRRNEWEETHGGTGICHSHDFCDPNQAMIDALGRFNVKLDLQDEQQSKLINDAWAIAKREGFAYPKE